MTKKVTSLLLALLMVFCLSGCKDEVQAYRDELMPIINEVSEMDTQVSEAVTAIQNAVSSGDEEAYNTTLEELRGYCDTLKEKYTAIANVKAPAEYAEDQKLMQQYADDMSKMLDASMRMYELAFEYSTSSDVSDEMLEEVEKLQNEITQYMDSTTEFDNVLNKVMGRTEN